MKYTGQTGRPFRVRFQEHIRDFKYNNSRSKFAQHLIDNKHAIGNMEDIMEIIHVTRKGKKAGYTRKFPHIQGSHGRKPTVRGNELFETKIQQDPYEGEQHHSNRTPKNSSVVRSHSPPQEGYATKG